MESKKQLFDKISEQYSGETDSNGVNKEIAKSDDSKNIINWVDQFWKNIHPKKESQLQIQSLTFHKIDSKKLRINPAYVTILKYAAVLVFILSIGSIFLFQSQVNQVVLTASSGIGEIKVIELPDGTKAWLNAKSSVSYPEEFIAENREISMTGEVYFEVTHDKKHPFIVKSELFNVKVLGTRFMISNYNDEPKVDTYLAEGSVEFQLNKSNKKIILAPGDEVKMDKVSLKYIKENNPHSVLDSWRFGKISFYNESMFEIARKLERRFGEKIEIGNDKVGNMKYTADFDKENLEQILAFFTEFSGLKYKNIGNKYLITTK